MRLIRLVVLCGVTGCASMPANLAAYNTLEQFRSHGDACLPRPYGLEPQVAWLEDAKAQRTAPPRSFTDATWVFAVGGLTQGDFQTVEWQAESNCVTAAVGRLRSAGTRDWREHAAQLQLTPGAFAGVLSREHPLAGFEELPPLELLFATQHPNIFISHDTGSVTTVVRVFNDERGKPAWPERTRGPTEDPQKYSSNFLTMFDAAYVTGRLELEATREVPSSERGWAQVRLRASQIHSDAFAALDAKLEAVDANHDKARAARAAEGLAAIAPLIKKLDAATSAAERFTAFVAVARAFIPVDFNGASLDPARKAIVERQLATLRAELPVLGREALGEGRVATAAFYGRAAQLLEVDLGERTLEDFMARANRPHDDLITPFFRNAVTIRPWWTTPAVFRPLEKDLNDVPVFSEFGLTTNTPKALEAFWEKHSGKMVLMNLDERDTLAMKVSQHPKGTTRYSEREVTGNPAWTAWRAKMKVLREKVDWAQAELDGWKSFGRPANEVSVTQYQGTQTVGSGANQTSARTLVTETRTTAFAATLFGKEEQERKGKLDAAVDAFNRALDDEPRDNVKVTQKEWTYDEEVQEWTGKFEWVVSAPAPFSLEVSARNWPDTSTRVRADAEHHVKASGVGVLSLDYGRMQSRDSVTRQIAATLVGDTRTAMRKRFDQVVRERGAKWSAANQSLERALLEHFLIEASPATVGLSGFPRQLLAP